MDVGLMEGLLNCFSQENIMGSKEFWVKYMKLKVFGEEKGKNILSWEYHMHTTYFWGKKMQGILLLKFKQSLPG